MRRIVNKRGLAQLKRGLKRHHITHDVVAAACDPPVGRPTVVRALSGDTTSANVIRTAERLLAEAKARNGETVTAA